MIQRIIVTAWSLWYLKPSMIYWRIYRTIKSVVLQCVELAGVSESLFRRKETVIPVIPFPLLTGQYYCEDISLAERRFSFLRDVLTLPASPEALRQAVENKPLLWQFHFGYHDYLLALLSRENSDHNILEQAVNFALEWDSIFALHQRGVRRSAWHPYVLSIRIESWVRLHGIAVAQGWLVEDPRLRSIASGVEQMSKVLLRNLEKGTMANHLLRNIKALVFAGLFLSNDTGASCRRIGMHLLHRELHEQILDDGCHFERSPMYHVSVLNDVLDMLEAIQLAGTTAPKELEHSAYIMTGFLRRILHPDGEIPMFNDSTRSFFLQTTQVLNRATVLCAELEDNDSRPLSSPLRDLKRVSGLFIAETPRLWLVFDAGLVGPDYQPGHAHCDTLSIELSVDGHRWITDTGVFHYRESVERKYSRSTAAHSTIQIDDAEQSEIWKSFRVGRRAKILHQNVYEQNGMTILCGVHDGYSRLQKGLLHERAIVLASDWIVVVDRLHGSGKHHWTSRLHFDQAVTATRYDGGISLKQGTTTALFSVSTGSVSVEKTDIYPAFGEKVQRQSIVVQDIGDFPLQMYYIMSFGAEIPVVEADPLRHGTLRVASVLLEPSMLSYATA